MIEVRDADGFLVKTIEQHFASWESSAFGFGYGTGEEHTLAALKSFLSCAGYDENGNPREKDCENSFDYRLLEGIQSPVVAWLMINVLCHQHILEYGTSPRFCWLTEEGCRLEDFVRARTVERLVEICCVDEDDTVCYPNACNCGPSGFAEGRKCPNPFWPRRK